MDIRRCTRQECDGLQQFWTIYQTGPETTDALPEEVQRLRHDVFENPFAAGQGTSWLAWEDNRPLGHLKASQCPAYYHGERVECAWWQGFYVLSGQNRKRRADAAVMLAFKVLGLQHGHAMLGTPGIDSRVFKLYERMNFYYWGAVPFCGRCPIFS